MKIAGFTLVELVIAMTVISVALAGTLMAINIVVKHSGDPMILQQAAAIADSYLQEIASKSFPTSMPCSGAQPAGGRPNYTTICDYRYIPAAGQVPTDQLGNTIAGLSNYTVKVTIDDTTASLQGLTAAATQVVRIDVSVAHPQISSPLLYSIYRANF